MKKKKQIMEEGDWEETLQETKEEIKCYYENDKFPSRIEFFGDRWIVGDFMDKRVSRPLEKILSNLDQGLLRFKEAMKTGLYSNPNHLDLISGSYSMVSNCVPGKYSTFDTIYFRLY